MEPWHKHCCGQQVGEGGMEGGRERRREGRREGGREEGREGGRGEGREGGRGPLLFGKHVTQNRGHIDAEQKVCVCVCYWSSANIGGNHPVQ